ncbi:beta-L-arabinofuranosidase domain-containing protein [Amycolatopsis sp. NPDC005232]|uniref:beta-L-arabinofuranosidase domain-containing protein n=1 Tax=Amycolatopsis sp. NPDC005232 TaxID=3157027 RepID=UPI0033B3DA45
MKVTRRAALGLGAVLGVAAAVPWEASASTAAPVRPVALGGVRLLESRYLANMRRTVAYLKFVDLDRLLHTFRLTAGLPSAAEPCGGWEAPDIQLRGHTTGHLLSGLALAAANTGDAELAAKGAEVVAALAECQAASPAAGFTEGYLSAFPESDFVNLEAGKSVWAPYYTIHKILAGLLDQHRLLGSAGALDVALGIASWIDARTAPLSRDAMQKVLHTEFGGMNEALANLYAITRDPLHLELARRFDHDEIFTPLAARQDTLAGRHANTDIAKIVGAAAEYDVTGEQRYRTIATYFWDQVVHHHSYVIGGNANAEFFGPPDQIVSQLGENTCENCNSYNMLKLGRLLFLQDPSRTEYLDHYEWTLLNQLLGEQDPDSPHGFVTYYTGLVPGTERKGKEGVDSDPGTYSSDYGNFTCDHGTGLETHAKYAENIYFTSGDTLSVNLFIPSTVDFHGASVRLETAYPYDETVRLRVDGSGEFALRVRIPAWVSKPRLTINHTPVAASPGSFATIRRRWHEGDVVELHLPMAARWLPAPDNPAVRALAYGPLVLAARHGSAVPPVIPTVDPRTLRREPGPAEFSVRSGEQRLRLSPFLDVQHEHYSVYFASPPDRPAPKTVAVYPLGADLTEGTHRWPAAVLAGGAVAGERGIELDGVDGHVRLAPGLPANLTELTVSMWVRSDTIVNSARVFDLGFNAQSYLFLTSRTGNGVARCAMKLGGMAAEDYVDAAIALPQGVWTHVVVTAGSGLRVYFDGELTGVNPAPPMSPLLLGATQLNYLGRSQNPKHPYLKGAVADFRLYGRALGETEVRALAAGQH